MLSVRDSAMDYANAQDAEAVVADGAKPSDTMDMDIDATPSTSELMDMDIDATPSTSALTDMDIDGTPSTSALIPPPGSPAAAELPRTPLFLPGTLSPTPNPEAWLHSWRLQTPSSLPAQSRSPTPTPVISPQPEFLGDIAPNLRTVKNHVKALLKEDRCLNFGGEQLPAKDFERFIRFSTKRGMANDNLINLYVRVLSRKPLIENSIHFGELFQMSPPARNFKIMTTFLYPKLKELLAAPAAQKPELTRQLARWFRADDLTSISTVLIPVNEPKNEHWLLAEVDYDTARLKLYDSWKPNWDSWQKGENSKYLDIFACLRCAVNVIYEASDRKQGIHVPNVYESHGWLAEVIAMPRQKNVVDCGFFSIMSLVHVVYFGRINAPACPPILRFSSDSMEKDSRVLLAASLLSWCKKYDESWPPEQRESSLPPDPLYQRQRLRSPSPSPHLTPRLSETKLVQSFIDNAAKDSDDNEDEAEADDAPTLADLDFIDDSEFPQSTVSRAIREEEEEEFFGFGLDAQAADVGREEEERQRRARQYAWELAEERRRELGGHAQSEHDVPQPDTPEPQPEVSEETQRDRRKQRARERLVSQIEHLRAIEASYWLRQKRWQLDVKDYDTLTTKYPDNKSYYVSQSKLRERQLAQLDDEWRQVHQQAQALRSQLESGHFPGEEEEAEAEAEAEAGVAVKILTDEGLDRMPVERLEVMIDIQRVLNAPIIKPRQRRKQMGEEPVEKGEWILLRQARKQARVIAYALDSSNFLVLDTTFLGKDCCETVVTRRPVLKKFALSIDPRPEELAQFRNSTLASALPRPYRGRACFALTAGDRVVGIQRPVLGVSSFIHRLARDSSGEYFAILPSRKQHPLSLFRRHFLDPGPAAQVCDLVSVVSGKHKNVLGHIVAIDRHIVWIETLTERKTIEVEMDTLVREFLPGQHIRILAGVQQGEDGLVVAVEPLGMLTVATGSGESTRQASKKERSLSVRPSDVGTIHWEPSPKEWTRPTSSGATPDLSDDDLSEFLNMEGIADQVKHALVRFRQLWLADPAELVAKAQGIFPPEAVPLDTLNEEELKYACKNPRYADAVLKRQEAMRPFALELASRRARLEAEEQRKGEEGLLSALRVVFEAKIKAQVIKEARDRLTALGDKNAALMKIGKRFEGWAVKIVGPGYATRGRVGWVEGDYDSEERRRRQESGEYSDDKDLLNQCRRDLAGIQCTVAFNGMEYPVQKVPIEHLVDAETNLPLTLAVYAKRNGSSSQRYVLPAMPPKPPAPRPPTPPPPTHANLTQWGQREIDGETDGTWYRYPVFEKRRIDVTLVDTKRTVGRTRTSKKQWDCEGKSGYLLPVEWFPLGKMNEKVQVYGLAQGSNKFHPHSIRPRRITDSGDPVERAFGERVIIIGPDATNDQSLRGEYALVVTGDAPEEYADVILTDGTSKRYHRTSLCLARNRELEVGPHIFPATAFPTHA